MRRFLYPVALGLRKRECGVGRFAISSSVRFARHKPIKLPRSFEPEVPLRWTIETIRLNNLSLPSPTLVFVGSRRDGRFADLTPRLELAHRVKYEPLPLIGKRHDFAMPSTEGEAWMVNEGQKLNSVRTEAAELLGVMIADTKIAQGGDRLRADHAGRAIRVLRFGERA